MRYKIERFNQEAIIKLGLCPNDLILLMYMLDIEKDVIKYKKEYHYCNIKDKKSGNVYNLKTEKCNFGEYFWMCHNTLITHLPLLYGNKAIRTAKNIIAEQIARFKNIGLVDQWLYKSQGTWTRYKFNPYLLKIITKSEALTLKDNLDITYYTTRNMGSITPHTPRKSGSMLTKSGEYAHEIRGVCSRNPGRQRFFLYNSSYKILPLNTTTEVSSFPFKGFSKETEKESFNESFNDDVKNEVKKEKKNPVKKSLESILDYYKNEYSLNEDEYNDLHYIYSTSMEKASLSRTETHLKKVFNEFGNNVTVFLNEWLHENHQEGKSLNFIYGVLKRKSSTASTASPARGNVRTLREKLVDEELEKKVEEVESTKPVRVFYTDREAEVIDKIEHHIAIAINRGDKETEEFCNKQLDLIASLSDIHKDCVIENKYFDLKPLNDYFRKKKNEEKEKNEETNLKNKAV